MVFALACGLSFGAGSNGPFIECTTQMSKTVATMELFNQLAALYSPTDYLDLAVPLTAETAIEAYSKGIFPWSCDETTKLGHWFFPANRFIFRLDTAEELKVPKRLERFIRNHPEYEVTFDKRFTEVMEHCATVDNRLGQSWITPQFMKVWKDLFHQGKAHSVEVSINGKLVGGLYGTFVNGVFFADSAFHLEKEASKIAFLALARRLKAHGHLFFDCQDHSQWTENLGAGYVTKFSFLDLMWTQQKKNLSF